MSSATSLHARGLILTALEPWAMSLCAELCPIRPCEGVNRIALKFVSPSRL